MVAKANDGLIAPSNEYSLFINQKLLLSVSSSTYLRKYDLFVNKSASFFSSCAQPKAPIPEIVLNEGMFFLSEPETRTWVQALSI